MAGAVSGLLGVGGGFLMVPLQVMLVRSPQLRANATSLGAIIPIALSGVLVYLFGSRGPSQVDIRFAVLLAAGGVIGAYLGARLASRVSETWLARLVAIVLVVVGVKQLVLP